MFLFSCAEVAHIGSGGYAPSSSLLKSNYNYGERLLLNRNFLMLVVLNAIQFPVFLHELLAKL